MRQTNDDTGGDLKGAGFQYVARLIALCAKQIQAATEEADVEIAALTRSILAMATHTAALEKAQADAARAASKDACIQLQFVDRLYQRLTNVQCNLDRLVDAMRASDAPISRLTCETLLHQARATFTIEKERDMFDAVFKKATEVPAAADSATEDRSLLEPGVHFGLTDLK